MAQKTQIILVDDIDGSEATQSVTFALDGVTYEIDLNDDHAAALRETVEEWTVKARRVSGRRTRRRAGAPKTSRTLRRCASGPALMAMRSPTAAYPRFSP